MRASSIAIAIAVIIMAIGVYYGLDRLFPRERDDAAVAQVQPSPMTTRPDTTAPRPVSPDETAVPGAATAESEEEVLEQDLGRADPPAEEVALAEDETLVESEEVEMEPAAPEPEVMEPEVAEPEVTEPAPKAAPAPAPAPRRAAPAPRAEEKMQGPVKKPPPAADAITPWWPNPATIPDPQLKLTYAGQVEGQSAIALLFSAPLNLQSLQGSGRVLDEGGRRIDGQWELGKNPRLAIFRTPQRGRYTVVLEPTVADARGNLLGTQLQGPVYVK